MAERSEPVAAAPSEPPAANNWEPREKDESGGLLGPFRLGPLIGVGLPSLLSLGGTIKLTRFLGGGINLGLIPTLRLSFYGQAKLSYQEVDVYGRIYPFGGSLFLGAGVGYATVKGTIENPSFTVNGVDTVEIPISSVGSVRTMVLTPQLGFLKTFAGGLSVGMDVGAQIPIAPSKIEFETQTPNLPQTVIDQYIKPNQEEVRNTLETIGRTPIPTVNLRLGWLL